MELKKKKKQKLTNKETKEKRNRMDAVQSWVALVGLFIRHTSYCRSFFGVDIDLLPILWLMIEDACMSCGLERIHLLWALYFL
jgi:hypothetical protein